MIYIKISSPSVSDHVISKRLIEAKFIYIYIYYQDDGS